MGCPTAGVPIILAALKVIILALAPQVTPVILLGTEKVKVPVPAEAAAESTNCVEFVMDAMVVLPGIKAPLTYCPFANNAVDATVTVVEAVVVTLAIVVMIEPIVVFAINCVSTVAVATVFAALAGATVAFIQLLPS